MFVTLCSKCKRGPFEVPLSLLWLGFRLNRVTCFCCCSIRLGGGRRRPSVRPFSTPAQVASLFFLPMYEGAGACMDIGVPGSPGDGGGGGPGKGTSDLFHSRLSVLLFLFLDLLSPFLSFLPVWRVWQDFSGPPVL